MNSFSTINITFCKCSLPLEGNNEPLYFLFFVFFILLQPIWVICCSNVFHYFPFFIVLGQNVKWYIIFSECWEYIEIDNEFKPGTILLRFALHGRCIRNEQPNFMHFFDRQLFIQIKVQTDYILSATLLGRLPTWQEITSAEKALLTGGLPDTNTKGVPDKGRDNRPGPALFGQGIKWEDALWACFTLWMLKPQRDVVQLAGWLCLWLCFSTSLCQLKCKKASWKGWWMGKECLEVWETVGRVGWTDSPSCSHVLYTC